MMLHSLLSVLWEIILTSACLLLHDTVFFSISGNLGLFIYCARGGFNETGSGSGSGSDSSSSSSSEELSFSVDDDFAEGCKRIDLDNQGNLLWLGSLL